MVSFCSYTWHGGAQCIHGLEDKNMTALPTPLKIAYFWNSNLRFVIHCFHRNLCKFWYSQKIIFYGTVFDTALWHAIMWWSIHQRLAVPLTRAALWWEIALKKPQQGHVGLCYINSWDSAPQHGHRQWNLQCCRVHRPTYKVTSLALISLLVDPLTYSLLNQVNSII